MFQPSHNFGFIGWSRGNAWRENFDVTDIAHEYLPNRTHPVYLLRRDQGHFCEARRLDGLA